jgi:hypothetical protein
MAEQTTAATHGQELQRTWELAPRDVLDAGLRWVRSLGGGRRTVALVATALAIVGAVALVLGPLLSGYANRQAWAYTAVAFLYLMSTAAAAPCLSTALRVARSHWRRPVNRVAEIWAVTLVLPLGLYLLLMGTLPGTEGRLSIWFGWPLSPWLWGAILMVTLAGCGYFFLWLSSLPDLAIVRDQAGGRGGLAARLAGSWRGSHLQWRMVEKGVNNVGVLYVLVYVATMTVLASDFVISMIPGYFTAVFPAYFTITSFQAGIALTIVTMAVLRRWGGQRDYLGLEQFWALGKMLLAFSLLWFYFWWSEFIIFWYGRTPREIALLEYLMAKTYLVPFVLGFALNFALPLLILLWNPIRRSIAGPTVVAGLVLVGNLIDRIRLTSAGFSVPDITKHQLYELPAAYVPTLLDLLVLAGAIGGAVALVLLAFRLVPFPSIWEVTGGLWLRQHVPFKHTWVIVVGKPE